MTLLTVTADELLEIVEHGVAATEPGASPGQFPQVAGIEFSFDASLSSGDRVQSLAIKDADGNIIDTVVEDSEVVGDNSRTFRLVTLSFLADGGDDYPFPDRDRIDLELEEEDPRTGDATAAPDGTEQDALAEFLLDNFSDSPFESEDFAPELDTRIQNLAFRDDTVLSAEDLGDAATGDDDSAADPGAVEGDNDSTDSDPVLASVFGTPDADTLEISGSNQVIFGNDGDDLIDFSTSAGDNLLFAGGGNDTVILGAGDRVFGDDGNDRIFATSGGNNVITGNLGADQFWIADAEFPESVG